MINYSGNTKEDDVYTGYEDSVHPYAVNCSGYVKIISKDARMYRKRVDYYLVYLINGAGHYQIEGKEHIVSAGNIILYKPGEQQQYYYCSGEQPEFYWIHFTGHAVENLLHDLNLGHQTIYPVGIHAENIEIFKTMIHELQVKKPLYEEFCTTYLMQLLYQFSRIQTYRRQGQEALIKNRDIEDVIKKMHIEYQEQHPIDYYAQQCSLSIYQFSRKFKSVIGVTPNKYIETIRMDKSKELLMSTDFTISEISNIIGYTDPFYFSKVFKRNNGITPTEFRKASVQARI